MNIQKILHFDGCLDSPVILGDKITKSPAYENELAIIIPIQHPTALLSSFNKRSAYKLKGIGVNTSIVYIKYVRLNTVSFNIG